MTASEPLVPRRLKVGIIVHCPSPHQKVLLDSVIARHDADVVVAYAFGKSVGRTWGEPVAEGTTVLVPDLPRFDSSKGYGGWIADFDRDVWILGSAFTYERTQRLADALHRVGRPWAYLGEPPRPRSRRRW